MRQKCRASKEIRNLFYECWHEKHARTKEKHARSEAPVGERCAMIGDRSMERALMRLDLRRTYDHASHRACART